MEAEGSTVPLDIIRTHGPFLHESIGPDHGEFEILRAAPETEVHHGLTLAERAIGRRDECFGAATAGIEADPRSDSVRVAAKGVQANAQSARIVGLVVRIGTMSGLPDLRAGVSRG